MVLTWESLCPPPQGWLANSGQGRRWWRALLASSRQRPGRLLNIIQCTRLPSQNTELFSTKCPCYHGWETPHFTFRHFSLIVEFTSWVKAGKSSLRKSFLSFVLSVPVDMRPSLPLILFPKPCWPSWTVSFLLILVPGWGWSERMWVRLKKST